MENQTQAFLRQMATRLQKLEEAIKRTQSEDIEDRLKQVAGRRVFFTHVGTQTFTTSQDGARGSAITFTVSQDGPFIMTHYPLVMWRSSLPSNATDLGRWRPVSSWPLPDQVLDTNIIDISYEMADDGSNRSLQNENTVPGGLLSRPDCLLQLPVKTYFRPNSVISFTPIYENILFEGSTATTQGTLVVALIGFKIVNL